METIFAAAQIPATVPSKSSASWVVGSIRARAPTTRTGISSCQSSKARFWRICAIPPDNSSSSALKKGVPSVPTSNYVVPLDSHSSSSTCLTRPLVEILRDLNKRVPDKVLKSDGPVESKYIPWYHANRMLSFYAPGWCGEVRNVNFSADGRAVSVVYRVTVRGSDAEAYREATGTVDLDESGVQDPVQVAEAVAFRRACARFGLGLYLYHEDETSGQYSK